MDEQTFKKKTRQFGLAVIRLVETLPRSRACDAICPELLRSAHLVGASYRAACSGGSDSEVVARLLILREEADKAIHWLELMTDSGLVASGCVMPLIGEGDEIIAQTSRLIEIAQKVMARREIQNVIPRSKDPRQEKRLPWLRNNPKSKI